VKTRALALIPQEIESTLLLSVARSAAATRRIAELRSVGDYVLEPRADQRIDDDYLDTEDGRLGAKRVALRIRSLNGVYRLTLKGPTERRSEPASGRLELEQSWTPAVAGRVLRVLAVLDIPLARRTASREWRKPEDFVRAMGLIHVQRRETLRRPRDVRVRARAMDPPLAELALDTVTYRIGRRKVRLFEVEIEAKRREGVRAADRVTTLMLERWEGALRSWPHSKLATGLALQALERDGKLEGALSTARWLTPKGVDLLSRRLERPRE
jgi:hypothetical protein